MTRTRILGATALIAVAAIGWMIFDSGSRNSTTANASVKVPELSGTAAEGAALYTKYCAECHGENGGGADKGPPLIHKYYRPNHHTDQAFMVATLQGAPQHHWKFGNMKPVEGITETQVINIITFVRAVQRANGIE